MTWKQGDSVTAKTATALAKEMRQVVAASSGYSDIKVLVNYAHGDEKIENIYGQDTLPRLAKLKKFWDPHNVFRFNNPLPDQYP